MGVLAPENFIIENMYFITAFLDVHIPFRGYSGFSSLSPLIPGAHIEKPEVSRLASALLHLSPETGVSRIQWEVQTDLLTPSPSHGRTGEAQASCSERCCHKIYCQSANKGFRNAQLPSQSVRQTINNNLRSITLNISISNHRSLGFYTIPEAHHHHALDKKRTLFRYDLKILLSCLWRMVKSMNIYVVIMWRTLHIHKDILF